MKLRNTLLGLGMAALLVGFAGLLSAETNQEVGVAASPEVECAAPLGIEAPDAAPVCEDALGAPGAGDSGDLQPPVLLGGCSGDLCGCYTPSCAEECPGLERACLSACRQEQKQCAIECCSP